MTFTDNSKDAVMDSNRIEGMCHQVKGAVKRAFGKIIGDAEMIADGAAEKASGDAHVAAAPSGGQVMGIDADRIKGVAHQLDGAIKEGIGRVMSDPKLQQAGIAEREAGKAQNAVGGARDTAREAVEKGK
jgi:uncharacterized protein YjbJ (UPF0337 family)